MASKYMKTCSASLDTREIQTKTPTGMTKIIIFKNEIMNIDKEKLEPSYVASGNVKCNCCGKQFTTSSKSWTQNYIESAISFLGYNQKNGKQGLRQLNVHNSQRVQITCVY